MLYFSVFIKGQAFEEMQFLRLNKVYQYQSLDLEMEAKYWIDF